MPKHVLRITDLSGEQVRQVLDVAGDLAHHPTEMQHALAGELVVLYLTAASTRTRVTFAHAAARVGATVVVVGPAELARRGGTLDGIAEAISDYAGAIVARTGDGDLERLAAAATVPVVNALSDRHQPVQALADLLTLRATFGALDGRRIAYIGDGTNVCHSLIEACAVTGIDLRLVCPPGRAPDAEVLARAAALPARVSTVQRGPEQLTAVLAGGAGEKVKRRGVSRAAPAGAAISGPTVTDDVAEAVAGVDALYLGPWLAGALPDDERAAVPSYPFTRELLDRAAPSAIVLHSQLRQLGTPDGSLARDVLRDPRSRGRAQAENHRHAAAALLVALHGGLIERSPARVLTTA